MSKHILAYSLQAWGHARPLANLMARLVKLRPVTVTLLTTNSFFERVKAELSLSFDENEEEAASRIRLVSIGQITPPMGLPVPVFAKAWKNIVKGKLVCAHTGTGYSTTPPDVVIMDSFERDIIMEVKAQSGDSTKVFSFNASLVAATLHDFGPKSLGGPGNIRLEAQSEARRSGKQLHNIIIEMVLTRITPSGEIIAVPGLPPMYDWEFSPQQLRPPIHVALKLYPDIAEILELCDGAICFTSESYEPEAIKAFKGWFSERGRPAYICGALPSSASKATANANEKKLSKDAVQIQDFLDKTLATCGERSLLYISFGSMYWPRLSPDMVWTVLDVVMELQIPFILSHASPFAVIPEEVKAKVEAYGKAFTSSWTPQQLILDHPATGWFLSHGGHNSVIEATTAGVPLIFWPFSGDQPVGAVHITHNLGVGYELLEVRSAEGLKPIYRTGYTPVGTTEALKTEARDILQKAFGEEGAQKRAKLEPLRKAMLAEWEDGGAAKKDMTAFLDSL